MTFNGKGSETLIPIRSKEGYTLRWVAEYKAVFGEVGKGPHGLVERIRADTVPTVWRQHRGADGLGSGKRHLPASSAMERNRSKERLSRRR